MFAIETQGLCRRFDKIPAVSDLSLAVEEGEIFGLVGPDGAGKTTTMRMLTGILDATEGRASVCGLDVARQPERVKEQIGYMSQRFGLYPDLTVMENIDFYADIYGVSRKERRPRAEELLAFSKLSPFKNRLAGNLSGGMKQKLGLACALIHTPRVIFLDEPTNGVDPVSRRDFWRILYQLLRQKVTIFVSTAYLDEAERCSRVALLHNGRLLGCGTANELRKMMKGTILEVQSPQARKVWAELRRELADCSVGLFGDRVHVVTDRPDETGERIRRTMQAGGLTLAGMRTVEPTLEDVFISAVGGLES